MEYSLGFCVLNFAFDDNQKTGELDSFACYRFSKTLCLSSSLLFELISVVGGGSRCPSGEISGVLLILADVRNIVAFLGCNAFAI